MPDSASVRNKVEACLRRFVQSMGQEAPVLTDRTNLLRDFGFASEDGVDFVLDLCDTFRFDFPHDFNPFVHDSGRRARRFGELVGRVEQFLETQEVTRG